MMVQSTTTLLPVGGYVGGGVVGVVTPAVRLGINNTHNGRERARKREREREQGRVSDRESLLDQQVGVGEPECLVWWSGVVVRIPRQTLL